MGILLEFTTFTVQYSIAEVTIITITDKPHCCIYMDLTGVWKILILPIFSVSDAMLWIFNLERCGNKNRKL